MCFPPGEAVGGGLALNGSSSSLVYIYIYIYIYIQAPPHETPPHNLVTAKNGVRKL